jgi:tripartite-type tricarboxylate transporter receptor subunit TctC
MHSQQRRRRMVLFPIAAGLSALGTSLARAQSVTLQANSDGGAVSRGGPTDIVARPFGLLPGNALKQSVVIDNRGGAGGSIGAAAVASAAPDGYTLLVGTVGTQSINPYLYKKLSYNPQKDLTPLATIASAPVAIVVNAATGIGSLADLVSQAKAKPGAMNYGSAGNGTPGHLTAAMFCTAAGIRLAHVPYKGSAPAVTEVIGGQIPVMFDPLQSVLPHIQSGKLKALAVTSLQRSPVLPDTPTVAELATPTSKPSHGGRCMGPPASPTPCRSNWSRRRSGSSVRRVQQQDQ